jgi:hypothetical protein
MLTPKQSDEAYELKEQIWSAVHDLVDTMTTDIDPEIDDEIRQQLTEEFRFWRRYAL